MEKYTARKLFFGLLFFILGPFLYYEGIIHYWNLLYMMLAVIITLFGVALLSRLFGEFLKNFFG